MNYKSILSKLIALIGKSMIGIIFLSFFLFLILILYSIFSMKVYEQNGNVPNFSIYTIATGSMAPYINELDVIVNRRIENPASIEIGDIITFRSSVRGIEGLTITHRVIDIVEVNGQREFQTRGDANISPDPANVREENLIGVKFLLLPGVGRIPNAIWYVFNAPNAIIYQSFLLIGVLIYIIWSIFLNKYHLLIYNKRTPMAWIPILQNYILGKLIFNEDISWLIIIPLILIAVFLPQMWLPVIIVLLLMNIYGIFRYLKLKKNNDRVISN